MKLIPFAIAVVLGVTATTGFAEDPDPIELLKKVDAATRAVKAVSYKAKLSMTGNRVFPGLDGEVWAQARGEAEFPRLKVTGKLGDGRIDVVTDGKEVVTLDSRAKVATRGKLPGAQRLLGVGTALWMQEFLHPTPFGDEIQGDSAKYEGTKTIGDVECDVVYVVYARNQGRARWYFGQKDHLPRRVDRIFATAAGEAVRTLTVTELNASPRFDADTFSVATPEGYEEKTFTPPPPRPELLAVGTEAPGWTLKNAAGKDVSLASLRGRVVLLDFWATWCGPCKRAMPGIQKIHEKFRGKPVAIIGVNCWERDDAPKFMKDNNYTYGLLLKGDDVAKAYKVSGIPTFYVIGPDGKIVHRASGFVPGLEEQLEKIIGGALPKAKKKITL